MLLHVARLHHNAKHPALVKQWVIACMCAAETKQYATPDAHVGRACMEVWPRMALQEHHPILGWRGSPTQPRVSYKLSHLMPHAF